MSTSSPAAAAMKTRHKSLDMQDSQCYVKKKQDILTTAKKKFWNLSETLRQVKAPVGDNLRSKSQVTLDYFFKHHNKTDNSSKVGERTYNPPPLKKQNSVGSYPIKIEITDTDNINKINRTRPATICVGKFFSDAKEAEAEALERPRKKLSFREPEIMGYNLPLRESKVLVPPVIRRSFSESDSMMKHWESVEDIDLESQAMRVVRTIGQSFEVCHKLSLVAPSPELLDQDEQDTQDLVSDQLSDITCDKLKKGPIAEGVNDQMSIILDDSGTKEPDESAKSQRQSQLDVLPTPSNLNSKQAPMNSAETYVSPKDGIMLASGNGGNASSSSAGGNTLSAHHELQLLREQLEQQTQQTQAAMAQLQLAREQFAAEQTARMEAQARIHQLLIHNRELLDHIAALVVHLQEGEKPTGQPQLLTHPAVPQQQLQQGQSDNSLHRGDRSDSISVEGSSIQQPLGMNPQGLIENHAVTSCLPHSPVRGNLGTAGSIFNFSYPPPEANFDAQLLQRLRTLIGYSPPQCTHSYNQNVPFLGGPSLYNQPYNTPQQQLASNIPSPLLARRSYAESPAVERRFSPSKDCEQQQLRQSQQNINMLHGHSGQHQQQQAENFLQQNHQSYQQHDQQNYSMNNQQSCQYLQNQLYFQPPKDSNHLQVQQGNEHSQQNSKPQFIMPLPQIGTLTTTDTDGHVQVIVPVPSNGADESSNILASLRLTDELPFNGPGITRSTSERIPNRSGLMSQVQRTAWARHTTK